MIQIIKGKQAVTARPNGWTPIPFVFNYLVCFKFSNCSGNFSHTRKIYYSKQILYVNVLLDIGPTIHKEQASSTGKGKLGMA